MGIALDWFVHATCYGFRGLRAAACKSESVHTALHFKYDPYLAFYFIRNTNINHFTMKSFRQEYKLLNYVITKKSKNIF